MPSLSRLSLFLLLLIASFPDADAQVFQRRKATASEPAPRALLVMLPTATRKMDALTRINDTVRLNSLRYDIAEIQRKMVADFRDNFSFCPVYFFYDTTSSYVRNGQLEGHLLDTGRHVAEPAHYSNVGDDYIVAFFGYRTREMGARQYRGDMEYFEMADGDVEAMIQQLVLLDAKMEQLVRPLPRTVANRYPGVKTKEKRPRYVYRHYAKYFDLQYKPSASRASTVLEKFYGTQVRATGSTAIVPATIEGSPK